MATPFAADTQKAATDRAAYRVYLVKKRDAETDDGVRRIIERLIGELDRGIGVGAVFKRAKFDRERLAYLQRFAREHPDPVWRERAERVLEGRS